jgi:hypothetical protein
MRRQNVEFLDRDARDEQHPGDHHEHGADDAQAQVETGLLSPVSPSRLGLISASLSWGARRRS